MWSNVEAVSHARWLVVPHAKSSSFWTDRDAIEENAFGGGAKRGTRDISWDISHHLTERWGSRSADSLTRKASAFPGSISLKLSQTAQQASFGIYSVEIMSGKFE
jgi:hypothetical protein